MILIGTVIQVTSMFMLSIARPGQYYQAKHHFFSAHRATPHSFWQVFLAQALGSGLGQSLLFLPSLSIIGHHYKTRRSTATGIAVTVNLP